MADKSNLIFSTGSKCRYGLVIRLGDGEQIVAVNNTGGRHAIFSSAGLDLQYGLASNVSLNATINPDFGQVEADPAVLNLSVFETFFEERRPLFVEGANIFRTPIQLFYSRRIGRRPVL